MSIAVYFDATTGAVERIDRSAHTPAAEAAGALIFRDGGAVPRVPVYQLTVVAGELIRDRDATPPARPASPLAAAVQAVLDDRRSIGSVADHAERDQHADALADEWSAL